MRTDKFLLITIISAIFLLNAGNVSAQTGFDAFWKKFKTAVAKKDKAAVAALSSLPVSMPYDVKPVRTRAQFLNRYNEIFYGEADAAKCFNRASVQEVSEKVREIACGFRRDTNGDGGEPLIYRFELTKAGWRFVSFDNINE